jgi:hypothetical protein
VKGMPARSRNSMIQPLAFKVNLTSQSGVIKLNETSRCRHTIVTKQGQVHGSFWLDLAR